MVHNSTCRFYQILRRNIIYIAARLKLFLNRVANKGLCVLTHHDIIAKRCLLTQRYYTQCLLKTDLEVFPAPLKLNATFFAGVSFIFSSLFVFPYLVEQLVVTEVAMVTN